MAAACETPRICGIMGEKGKENVMKLTTLCYIERDGCYLMMHRIKKDQDENAGKWIGIGGHLEAGETPEECIRREALEETGLKLTGLKLAGIITFILPKWGDELTFLYTAAAEGGLRPDCSEGVLEWVPKDKVMDLALWPGDRIFLPLLTSRKDVFSLKLTYNEKDELTGSHLEPAE